MLLLKHKNKQTVLRWSQLANRKINCDVMFTDVNRFVMVLLTGAS